jgi:hypothetical protein
MKKLAANKERLGAHSGNNDKGEKGGEVEQFFSADQGR